MKAKAPRPGSTPPVKALLGDRATSTLVDALARYLAEEEERQERLAKRRGYGS